MKVCHSFSEVPKSIFLAGPTPRSEDVASWRPEALDMIERLGFEGSVYVPEHPDWKAIGTYDKQVHWEWEAINASTVVAFWVPRNMTTMPAMTTNVEFGMLANSGKLVFGSPADAVKNRYLESLAQRYRVHVHGTLELTMRAAVAQATGIFGQ